MAPRRRATAFWLACVLLLLTAGRMTVQADDDPLSALPAEAQYVIHAINEARIQAGVPPLIVNPLLNQAAQAHVDDMIAHRRYGHRGSDGSNASQRVMRTGYSLSGRAGENWVAARSPERAIRWWMSDPPHRANILNPRWREIGIGVGAHPDGWGLIFVTDFTTGSLGPPADPEPRPAMEGGQDSGTPAKEPVEIPEPVTLEVPPDGMDYVIQPGDTLIGIGVRYGIDWPLIAAVNGLTADSILQIGQVIRLPGVNTPVPPPEVVSQSAREEEEAAIIPARLGPSRSYVVQAGDTLIAIARRFGVSWQELARANGLSEASLLHIGDVLQVPAPSPAIVPAPRTHIVASGDTIITIAQRYGVDWRELLRLNSLTESSILQIGQTIRLP